MLQGAFDNYVTTLFQVEVPASKGKVTWWVINFIEVVVYYFTILSRNSSEETEESHEKLTKPVSLTDILTLVPNVKLDD